MFFSISAFAQYSPEKQYKQDPLLMDTTSKLFRQAYSKKSKPGSPNIVVVMLDDVGYSTSASFGGIAETPTFDRLAKKGLKYTNFHTTALCAPSRAALLTGRNHHNVHMGHFTETAFDAPGYDAYMPFEKATIAEVLRENGYNTFAVGKWHLTPVLERSAAGPFNRWPTGRGFDRFYGFHESATDQYYPVLWEGITKAPIDTALGKHLNTYLADQAIAYIGDQKKADPKKPFFLYLTPGAVHSPMQVHKQWIDKYKGRFDSGWDVYRTETLKRQKALGVVPQNTTLPARNEKIAAWSSLPQAEKQVAARAMEAHAGFLSQTDYEVGRILDFIGQIGQMENTVVMIIIGDNGATKYTEDIPGEPLGLDKLSRTERAEAALKNIDRIGRKDFKGDIPLGWTQVSNTPFKYWKADANSEGGTHNPMIFYAPKLIQEAGLRKQYVHLIDIWPTILELTHADVPKAINGYPQLPIDGVSFAYSIVQANAESKHRQQYYETGASRAMYKDGWKAATLHTPGQSYLNDVWHLYNMQTDFNEQKDLSAKYPQKLAELRALFEEEAKKNNVYPLHESWFPKDEHLRISDSRQNK
ncbi:arylsulfatase [Pedobacter sp. AW1-32]|uniref:arylsulfatase n=1 Tax=Pedobacter sp. AW1-32 TaxID=3383026 RepID=UPI003FEF4453